jgi:hypothetical protein
MGDYAELDCESRILHLDLGNATSVLPDLQQAADQKLDDERGAVRGELQIRRTGGRTVLKFDLIASPNTG